MAYVTNRNPLRAMRFNGIPYNAPKEFCADCVAGVWTVQVAGLLLDVEESEIVRIEWDIESQGLVETFSGIFGVHKIHKNHDIVFISLDTVTRKAG